MLFQFHYGSIKSTIKICRHSPCRNFNSTMVRLKDWLKDGLGTNPQIFQFHYGSIKRLTWLVISLVSLVFQFHYGSIKSESMIFKIVNNHISIPLWFD